MANDLEKITSIGAAPQYISSGAEAEAQRAIAEVQAAMVLAKKFPRDIDIAIKEIVRECKRVALAESALYEYARGGTKIEGPSIRLAEALALSWGNIHSGWRELDRKIINGQPHAEIEAWAWDIERNRRSPITFKVKLWRDLKDKPGYPLKDERDIYEHCANQAKRRERACILALIPGYIVDMAVDAVKETLKTTVNTETTKKLIDTFRERFGVSKEQLEAFIQRNIEAIEPGQVVRLRQIANSLKDGMSKPEEWFPKDEPKPDAGQPVNKGAEGVKEKLKAQQSAPTPPITGVMLTATSVPAEEAKAEAAPMVADPVMPSPSPNFSLENADFSTQKGTKEAATRMILGLESIPVAERPSYFMGNRGTELLDALGQHGLGMMKNNITSLGIKL